jgi:hypothetical protein
MEGFFYAMETQDRIQPKDILQQRPLMDHVRVVAEDIYAKYENILGLREDGTRIQHAEKVIGIMQENLKEAPIPNELLAAAYIKDIVDIYYDCKDDPSCKEMMFDLTESLYAGVATEESKLQIDRTLGFAISAHGYDEASKSWRKDLAENILNEIQALSRQSAPVPPFYLEIWNSINGSGNVNTKIIPPSYRVPVADIELMVETSTRWDIEGLILQTADTIQNIRSPQKSQPASTWRSAQELYSFYGPLLDLGGIKGFSMLAYSESIVRLHSDEDAARIIEAASFIHETGNAIRQEINLQIRDAAINLRNEFPNDPTAGYYKMFREVYERLADATFRVKSVGRIADKARSMVLKDKIKELKDAGTKVTQEMKDKISKEITTGEILSYVKKVPDTIGMRVVLPDSLVEDYDVVEIFKQVANDLIVKIETDAAIQTASGRPGNDEEAPVSIDVGDTNKGYQPIKIGDSYFTTMELGPERSSGYQALHINLQFGYIGIEIQIVTESMDKKNNTQAHHILYVNSNGNGEQYSDSEQLIAIEKVRERFQQFQYGNIGLTSESNEAIERIMQDIHLVN